MNAKYECNLKSPPKGPRQPSTSMAQHSRQYLTVTHFVGYDDGQGSTVKWSSYRTVIGLCRVKTTHSLTVQFKLGTLTEAVNMSSSITTAG